MSHHGRDRANGLGQILLFDVGVERVVHRPQERVVDFLNEPGRIGGGRQEVGLEAIEILQNESDVGLARVVCGLSEDILAA